METGQTVTCELTVGVGEVTVVAPRLEAKAEPLGKTFHKTLTEAVDGQKKKTTCEQIFHKLFIDAANLLAMPRMD